MSAIRFIAWGTFKDKPLSDSERNLLRKGVRAEFQAHGYTLEGGNTRDWFRIIKPRVLIERKLNGRGVWRKRKLIFRGDLYHCCKYATENLLPKGVADAA